MDILEVRKGLDQVVGGYSRLEQVSGFFQPLLIIHHVIPKGKSSTYPSLVKLTELSEEALKAALAAEFKPLSRDSEGWKNGAAWLVCKANIIKKPVHTQSIVMKGLQRKFRSQDMGWDWFL